MFVKKSEFESIANLLFNKYTNFIPSGEEFVKLPEEQKKCILDADMAITNIMKRHIEQNKKTSAYIANKRKKDKNYAR